MNDKNTAVSELGILSLSQKIYLVHCQLEELGIVYHLFLSQSQMHIIHVDHVYPCMGSVS